MFSKNGMKRHDIQIIVRILHTEHIHILPERLSATAIYIERGRHATGTSLDHRIKSPRENV